MSANADLLARRTKAIPRGLSIATQVFAHRAENAELWDIEGRRYIDFAAGIAVLNTGHRHPKVIAAVEAQLKRVTHTAFQVMSYEPYIQLAERLNGMAPFKGPAKTMFLTTGAEAVENAVKIARYATGRSAVIAFSGAFHGRTMMTMALTGKVVPYKKGFGPMPADVFHVPFPIPHYGVTAEDSLKALQILFKADVDPARVAAIIIEPMQGEGGFHIAPPELLRGIRALCDEHGIVMIADEVQTGFARTGKMFGIEHSGVEPDMITIAKALGGGFPLSGVIGRTKIMDTVEPGGLGGTYAGSPIACAAALAVLDVIEEEKLTARAAAIGAHAAERLRTMARKNDLVPMTNVRNFGAMIAFDIVKGRGAHEPDGDAVKRVQARALESGLIVISCGIYGESIRILVPLTVSDAILDEGLSILEGALAA